ncbi:hypothetical protein R1CP_40150 (plasmid) [Rhodococcus opacus]|uniref:Uncharacterized protein n=1 Tax=Rhodococcus opacus TaxID=37919 RepID=A0A1B1KJ35_RHOOP|nr:DUF6308 family protein [Rhodococcus opacus]ANS32610.1 hypothetical protein R1CP_40150 [Rhodococcus opacus]
MIDLSVEIGSEAVAAAQDHDAARAVLGTEAVALNALLRAVRPDRDGFDEPVPLALGRPAWGLETALWTCRDRPDEGNEVDRPQTPRLYPSWDSVVSQVLGTERAHLNPVREALRADDGALHRRLLSIREEAGLPEGISALRVFDVIAWMDGRTVAWVNVLTGKMTCPGMVWTRGWRISLGGVRGPAAVVLLLSAGGDLVAALRKCSAAEGVSARLIHLVRA